MPVAWTSEWAKTHPVEAQIISDELDMERMEEEREKVSCAYCYHFLCDYSALKTGWGICIANTTEGEPYFSQEWETCDNFTPYEG